MQKWSLSKRMFLVSILWISLSVMVVISAPVESGTGQAISSAPQADPMAKDSSGVLQRFMSELLDAVKANDRSREQELIRGLVLPTDSSWFAAYFDKKTADLLRSAYQESMKDFEATARRLYEADVQRGQSTYTSTVMPTPRPPRRLFLRCCGAWIRQPLCMKCQ